MRLTLYIFTNLGSDILDQLLSVLLGTSMFVGGTIGFILDNTIPGKLPAKSHLIISII